MSAGVQGVQACQGALRELFAFIHLDNLNSKYFKKWPHNALMSTLNHFAGNRTLLNFLLTSQTE